VFGLSAFAQSPFASTGNNQYVFSLTENAGLADVLSITAQFAVSDTENLNPADSSISSTTYNLSIVEAWGQTLIPVTTPAFADSAFGGGTFAGSNTSVVYAPNPIYVVVCNFPDSITESSTVSNTDSEQDVFYEGIVEGFNPADSSTQASQFYFTDTEGLTSADVRSINAGFLESIVEALTSGNVDSEQDVFYEGIVEGFNPADSYSAIATYNLSIVEAWGQTPIPVTTPAFAGFAFGGGTFAGSNTSVVYAPNPIYVVVCNFPDSITENSTLAETETASQGFYPIVVENANLADSSIQQSQFFFTITETIIAIIDLYAVGGWIKINDSQEVTWVLINNSQSTSWTPINDSQESTWILINNTQ
jgi:hypothetical protein